MAKTDNSLDAQFVYSLTSLLMAEIHRLEVEIERLKMVNEPLSEINSRLNKKLEEYKLKIQV